MKIKLTLIALLVAGMALAQAPQKNRAQHQNHRLDRLDSIVGLTDQQRAEMQEIAKDQMHKMRELRNGDSKPNREEHKMMRDEMQSKMEAVLTPDQKAALKNHKDTMAVKKKAMRNELKDYRQTNIEPTMNRLQEEMMGKFTAEEVAKIELVRSQVKAKKEAYQAVDSSDKKRLSHDQRKALHQFAKTELSDVISAHKDDFAKMQADLKPLKETWKADMEQIRKKHLPETDGGNKHGKANHQRHHKGKHDKKCNDDCKKAKSGKKDKAELEQNRLEHGAIKFLLKEDGSHKPKD